MLLISISLFLYPSVSKIINEFKAESTIKQYDSTLQAISTAEKEKYLAQAKKYNDNLCNNVSDSFSPDAFNVDPSYEEILNLTDDGQIGSVSIPKIDCNLPIYHGTDESILEKGACHMASTSFPIGGEGTHSVISAHTAYPGKVFFDRLTQLNIDDTFYVTVLDETLAYKVCDIFIVEPTDTEKLKIVNSKDYITLVTCTPYSVNTHRLFVRGERVIESNNKVLADSKTSDTLEIQNQSFKSMRLIITVAAIVVLLVVVILIIRRKGAKNK